MILWLQAIESLILAAPGDSDPLSDWGVWDSTIARLGCADAEEAAERVYWDLLEADEIEAALPFFILKNVEQRWQTPGQNGYPFGAVDIFYAEEATDEAGLGQLPGLGQDHKRSLEYFAAWVEALMAYVADNANTGGMPTVASLEEIVEPQRTPRDQRDRDRPASDYWWTCWRLTIGASP
jgi:hypothetical protein